MGFIEVNDLQGGTHVLEAVGGFRVMELIRDRLDGLEVSLAGA
jgi:hypothetical protein